MFYDLYLLRRQNEGRFAMAWAAATRGIANTTREFGIKKLRELNITLLCEETMEYLQNTSNNPKKRLSLRMTIFLIRGTVFIFNKQVSIFQDDLANFLTKITIPQQISSITLSDVIPSQRDFQTPPTPVIKEKRKRKQPTKAADEISALENFLRLGQEQEVIEQPIDVDERRRRLQMVEEQPLIQLGVTDDILGDLGVVPLVKVPEKALSEAGSVKSTLEKIEELLAAEEEQTKTQKVMPRFKRTKSILSLEGSPKIIQVEAIVHRAGEAEEKGSTFEATVTEKIPHRMPSETMILPEGKRTGITEEPLIMEEEQIHVVRQIFAPEQVVEKEQILEVEPTPVREKEKPAKKSVARRLEEASPKSSQESEEEIKKKKALIDKYLAVKFKKSRRVLHLDDYDKVYELKEDFKIDIFDERILDANVRMHMIRKFSKIDQIKPDEMIRREGNSASHSSDIHGPVPKLSHLPTPLEPEAMSTPQVLTDITKLATTVQPVLSTPFREDVSVPHKKLYEETRIEIEEIIPEKPEKFKEIFAPEVPQEETQTKDSESYTIFEPSIQKLKPSEESQEIRRKKIIETVKQWDESYELTFDDLIPTPKNRKNAALTFGDLLALSKDGYVNLFPEENSLMLKCVRKGRMLQ